MFAIFGEIMGSCRDHQIHRGVRHVLEHHRVWVELDRIHRVAECGPSIVRADLFHCF